MNTPYRIPTILIVELVPRDKKAPKEEWIKAEDLPLMLPVGLQLREEGWLHDKNFLVVKQVEFNLSTGCYVVQLNELLADSKAHLQRLREGLQEVGWRRSPPDRLLTQEEASLYYGYEPREE